MSEAEGHELRMGILDHLTELRDRVIKAFLAVTIGTIIGFFIANYALQVLQQPYCQLVQTLDECKFQNIGPTDGVVVYFRVALTIGGILAIPIITYQFLMFVNPGLTAKERRLVLTALPAITLLFIIGVIFTWFILLPPALGFLEQFLPEVFTSDWTADLYINFVTTLIFWMGVAFETPLIFFVLSLMGVVSARVLARNWRIAIVGASIAAAFITPTIDPVNMLIVMTPLLALYVLSIGLVAIGGRIYRRSTGLE